MIALQGLYVIEGGAALDSISSPLSEPRRVISYKLISVFCGRVGSVRAAVLVFECVRRPSLPLRLVIGLLPVETSTRLDVPTRESMTE